MAARYWVGGTGTWDSTNTTNWSATSGGAGGASVPGSADTPTFDSNSGTGTVTFTNGGVTSGGVTINSTNITLSLGAAITISGGLTLTVGTFTTNDYNVTATSLSSSNSNTRTINLGSSTVTLSGSTPVIFTTTTGLTFNAGTSTITCSSGTASFTGAGLSYATVYLSSSLSTTRTITGSNTFATLSIERYSSAGIATLIFSADQTIGVLDLRSSSSAANRVFVRATTLGTPQTLTVGTITGTGGIVKDYDFRDITVDGAAAPISGTRLGDCKGNSGITFDVGKTVYFRATGAANWGSASSWALTLGGTATDTAIPLAQDTAVFPSATYPSSGSTVTLNASYNIGTIDMSARTSNTMTLATGSTTPAIYGNWINGTGITLTGTGSLTFSGRGSQTITSAGKSFSQRFFIDTPGGSVTLQDALSVTYATTTGLTLTSGTFDANGYNVTITGTASGFNSSNSNIRTLAIGSGTWSVTGSTNWNCATSTNLTVTGTGTISMVSASSKSFAGGNIQTYPTLNQGGTGTLTVTGSNKFAGLTNTAIGRIQFSGGTTNEFTSFTISGALGNLLPLGSTNTTQAILKKPSAWNMGLLSMDMGNNTGLNFLSNDGTMEYLSVSYINGQTTASTSTIYYGSINVTTLYYGSSPVTAVYYGSTQVF